jgi:chemotaxis protein MotB
MRPWLSSAFGHKHEQYREMKESQCAASELIGTDSTAPGVYGEQDVLFHARMSKTVHWSVPWSDLMMTMFILFAIMYVYHSSKREPSTAEATAANVRPDVKTGASVNSSGTRTGDANSISKIYDLTKHTLRARDLESFASVDLVRDKAVRIILTGDLLFDTGKADLKPESRNSLREIASIILHTPYMVSVVGHTDNVPIRTDQFPSNWELSVVRACQVARFLIEDVGIPENRLYVGGHANYQPAKPNNTDRNRAANRRVEIIMTKERPRGTSRSVENIQHK